MWDYLEMAAWAVSALIFLWMFVDMIRVGHHYSEEMLVSSREGVDELFAEKKGG